MPFYYTRTVRFAETDAAGVVYFANLFQFCHEAYEASLATAGIDLKEFFCQPKIAFPIIHSEADFYRPLTCGDCLDIELTPVFCPPDEYEINYKIRLADRAVAKATTRHVCIDAHQRTRQPLPKVLLNWLHKWSN
ncbi:acyl-CoA thioesterase [Roseofilum sp. Belize BBD 4]|uniref:acyl-CoA thioesterase n=1 Tax=unclassified Roseofilum TaxID=2620099 RepID=UPI000E7FE6BA|nr:acyl-CoA thioesterase [Roseofilum sp. Belize Diploria]MBP0032965.1 acyl-CoA thioesterase [Roseofilum sp. Belize BBD 4]HBR00710.1 1,4-dihydroxy-2-naphthoyl-CoA hydrolase [Cyanobacteria bacterium UBA11691]